MSDIRKIVAQSYERYNGGARVKRQYGSATVTKFFVEEKGKPDTRMEVAGYGATPGERKTFAVKRYAEAKGIVDKPKEGGEVRPWGGSTVSSRVDARPETPKQSALYEMVRQSQALGDSMLKGFSGADRADSELYFLEAQVYRDVSQGVPLATAMAKADARWREYAKGQQKKVDEAGKIQRGPMQGQSAAHYKWVDPEHFSHKASHIAFMVHKAEEQSGPAPSLPPGTSVG